jgi:hypothetical protein
MDDTAISVESLATEYLRLFDEGWNPNIDEFLGRVPEEMREDCQKRIEELAALNGLDLSQPPAAPAPVDDLGMLAQEITPEGEDATPAPKVRRTASVFDEMTALAASDTKKPGKRRGKRPAEPKPLLDPAAIHEGIEALAEMEEPVPEPEYAAEPVDAELPPEPAPIEEALPEIDAEMALEPAVEETPVEEVPLPRTRRVRDEPSYGVPGPKATGKVAVKPPPAKPSPRPAARPATPAANEEALRQLLAQLREVSHLERQGGIPEAESDRLHVIYRRLLDTESAAELPVTLPHLALYAFVAAAVAGAALFVACVRDAAPALQALVPGAVFLTLVGAGARARFRGDDGAAALFLAGASVAAAPAIVAALAAAGILAGAGALPAPLTDTRLLAGAAGGLLFAASAFLLLRRGLFAWAAAVLAAASWGAFVLTLGVGDLKAHEIALRFLPLVLLTVPGLLLESQGKVRFAMPFHLVALGALLGALDVMALRGGLLEILGLGSVAGEARLPYLGFAAAGLVLAGASLALERARSFDLRRGGRFLRLVAAVHLVGALGWNAAVNGAGRDVVALAVASVLLLVLGRFGSRRSFLAAGGLGLVLALCLAAVGGAAAPAPYSLALAGAGLLGALGIHLYLGRRGA